MMETLLGHGLMPFLLITWPRNWRVLCLNLHFWWLSFKPNLWLVFITLFRRWSCSSSVAPNTIRVEDSAFVLLQPFRHFALEYLWRWSYSKWELLKAVAFFLSYECGWFLISWLRAICQNPLAASSVENTALPASLCRMLSIVGKTYFSLLTFSFSLVRPTQIFTFPEFLITGTTGATHYVGSVTLSIIPFSSILFNSASTFG